MSVTYVCWRQIPPFSFNLLILIHINEVVISLSLLLLDRKKQLHIKTLSKGGWSHNRFGFPCLQYPPFILCLFTEAYCVQRSTLKALVHREGAHMWIILHGVYRIRTHRIGYREVEF